MTGHEANGTLSDENSFALGERIALGFGDGSNGPVTQPYESEAERLLLEIECSRDRGEKLDIIRSILEKERDSIGRDWPQLLRVLIVLCKTPDSMLRSVFMLAFLFKIPQAGKTLAQLALNLDLSETQTRRLLEEFSKGRSPETPGFITQMQRMTAETAHR